MTLPEILRQQAPHPVYPTIDAEAEAESFRVRVGGQSVRMGWNELLQTLAAREELIENERLDPFHCGYEPPAWDEIDWELCKLRVENPGLPIELLITGGNGGGKSFYCASRVMQFTCGRPGSLVWVHSEDENNSVAIPQEKLYHYLPLEYKTDRGSVRKTAADKLNYNAASGFTDNRFSIGATVVEFRFWTKEITTLEGPRPHVAWSDEEIPNEWMEGITRRLLTHAGLTRDVSEFQRLLAEKAANPALKFPRSLLPLLLLGVHLISFTPKSGYTPTVREFLHGGQVLRTVEAELLPLDKHGKVKRTPKLVRGVTGTRLAYWLHPWDNPHGGNWEGMKKMAVGKPEAYVKWWAYGVCETTSGVIFVKWQRKVHVRPLARLPKKGTWFMSADPCDGARNWFMQWIKVAPTGEILCAREWPQPNDYIPGHGQIGPWAIMPQGKSKAKDGDRGPAQRSLGGGLRFIAREIRRVERQLGELEWELAGKPNGGPKPIVIRHGHRIMDARAGNTESMANTEALTMIQRMERVWLAPDGVTIDEPGETESGIYFRPVGRDSGSVEGGNSSLKLGYKMIEDLLDYDDPDGITGKAPRLYVADNCENTIFSFENLTGMDGGKGACKDPMDGLRYLIIGGPQHVAEEDMKERGGGWY